MQSLKIPRGEVVWTTYFDRAGKILYIMTSKSIRDAYFLYEVSGETLNKLGKGISPTELEEKFNIKGKLGMQ